MEIGAQLYTVRNYTQTEQDFAATAKRVAEMGYRYIQVSGIGPLDPHFIRLVCDDNNLKIVLTHTKLDIVNDVDSVLEYHSILGCPYIGIGSGRKYRNAECIERFADDYYEPAQRMKEAGFRFMYHTHSDEWGRLPDGRLILDGLLKDMPASVMGITLDLYWLQYAGCNTLKWIEILKDRLQCVHAKDMAIAGNQQRMAPVGAGNMDYVSIVELLKKLGKTEYLLVEQDECGEDDPFTCLDSSLRYLRSIV